MSPVKNGIVAILGKKSLLRLSFLCITFVVAVGKWVAPRSSEAAPIGPLLG